MLIGLADQVMFPEVAFPGAFETLLELPALLELLEVPFELLLELVPLVAEELVDPQAERVRATPARRAPAPRALRRARDGRDGAEDEKIEESVMHALSGSTGGYPSRDGQWT